MLRRLFLSSLVVQSISSLVAMEGSCKSSVHLWKSPWAVFTAFCTSLQPGRLKRSKRIIISCSAAAMAGQPRVQLSREAQLSPKHLSFKQFLSLFCKIRICSTCWTIPSHVAAQNAEQQLAGQLLMKGPVSLGEVSVECHTGKPGQSV